MSTSPARGGQWTFLTNHARVLLRIARDADVRLRDVAADIGITERAAQIIVADLEASGYLTRTRVGRRNRYTIDPTVSLRHPSEAGHPVGDLLNTFLHREEAPVPAPASPRSPAPASPGRPAPAKPSAPPAESSAGSVPSVPED